MVLMSLRIVGDPMGPEAVFTESPSGIAFGVSSDIHLVFLLVLISPKSFFEGTSKISRFLRLRSA